MAVRLLEKPLFENFTDHVVSDVSHFCLREGGREGEQITHHVRSNSGEGTWEKVKARPRATNRAYCREAKEISTIMSKRRTTHHTGEHSTVRTIHLLRNVFGHSDLPATEVKGHT